MKHIAIFLLAVFLALPALAQTPDEDRGYIQGLIEDALSDAGRDVRITGFTGALSSEASLDTLTIADSEGVWLRLEDAVLRWNRSALFGKRLEVEALTAGRLEILRAPITNAPDPEAPGLALPELPAPGASPFTVPELPVAIDVKELSIDALVLDESLFGEEATVRVAGSAALAGGEGSANLTITRIDDVAGAFVLDAGFSNETRVLRLELQLEEAAAGIAANLIGLPGRPSVDLSVQGEDPIDDFTARIALETDGVPRLTGEVVLQAPGEDADQRFALDVSGDIRALLPPENRAFVGDDVALSVAATRPADGGLVLSDLTLRADALTLRGMLSLGPDGWPERVDLTGQLAPVGGAATLALGEGRRIEGADLAVQFDADQSDEWTALVSLRGLVQGEVSVARAELDGRGTLDPGEGTALGRAAGTVDVNVTGIDIADPALSGAVGPFLRGRLSFVVPGNGPLRFDELRLSGSHYTLSGRAELADPASGLDLDTTLELRTPELSRFAPLIGQPLSGAARVTLAGEAQLLDGTFDLDLEGITRDLGIGNARLDPLIGGQGRIAVSAARDTEGLEVERFSIRTEAAEITGAATLGSGSSTLRVTAGLSDTGLLADPMSGPAELSLNAEQDGAEWNISLEGSGPGGAALSLRGIAQADGGALQGIDGRVSLRADSLAPYGWIAGLDLAGGVAIAAEGTADFTDGSGMASVEGSADGLSTGIDAVDILLDGTTGFSAEVRRTDTGVIAFDELLLRTPELVADLTGSLGPERSYIRFNADLADMGLFVPDFSGPVAAEGTAELQGGDWNVDTRLTGPGGTRAAVEGSVAPDASRANLSIDGTGPLAIINRFIAPRLASGPVSFDLDLAGPLALSSLSGTVRTDGASLSLPAEGLALSGISATARIANGRAQVQAGMDVSSGGRLTLSGPVSLSAPYSAGLRAGLSGVGLVDPGLYETTVSGEVTIDGPLTGGARIAGDLALGPVELRIPDGAGAQGEAIPGLVHVNEPPDVRRTRARAGLLDTGEGSNGGGADGGGPVYPLDLRIEAANRIFVRGRGLDAELGGALRLTGTTQAVAPVGRFDLIRGRLDLLGQRITLTEGFARLQGDFDPFLRMVAQTDAGDLSIRLILEGPASSPELTITSTPELPDDEILSRLLFGRDLGEISALQAVQIASAVNTLAGGGSGIVANLRDRFGLDDLDIATDEAGGTSVSVGKYLGENLYSDVTVDSQGQTEINLNLEITPSITARGSVGSDGGTGIGIFIERDY